MLLGLRNGCVCASGGCDRCGGAVVADVVNGRVSPLLGLLCFWSITLAGR